MKDIIAKYTDALLATYINEGISRCLSKAVFQIGQLKNMDDKSRIRYFSRLIDADLALSIHILVLYYSCTNLSVEEIRERFDRKTQAKIKDLKQLEYVDLSRKKHDLSETIIGGINEVRKSTEYTKLLNKIHSISDVCFAALMIESSNLIVPAFELVVKHIKDDDSIDEFIDRACIQINGLNEQLRGKIAIRFLYNTYRYCDSPIALIMVKRFNLHSTIIGKDNLEEANSFFQEILENNDYNYLQKVEKSFPGLSFDSLAVTDIDFINRVICAYPDSISGEEMIYGLRLSEHIISQSGKERDSLVYWWKIVCGAVEQNPSLGKEEKEYIKVYYLLRTIENDPSSFNSTNLLGDNEAHTINLKLLSKLEQNVTALLITYIPERVKEFLSWLKNWNFYSYEEDEYRFKPCNHDDNSRRYIEALSYLYSDEDLLYIYMNSFLKSSLPVRLLFKVLYEHFMKQRDDHMMVKELFKEYRMVGKVCKYRGNIFIDSMSFNNDGSVINIYNYSDAIFHELDQYYQKNRSEGREAFVHFNIAAFLVNNDFCPQVHLDYSEFLSTDLKDLSNKLLEKYNESLVRIATKETIDKEDITSIEEMPAIKISPDNAAQIGLAIVRCCSSFDNNRQRVNFLKRLRFNPYDIKRYYLVRVNDLQDNYAVRSLFYDVIKDQGFFKDKFYLYCNSPLRTNYYLDYFIQKAEVLNGQFRLNEYFTDINTYFTGKIESIDVSNNIAYITPLAVNVGRNTRYKCTINKFVQLDVGDTIKFVIDYYDGATKTFAVSEYKKKERYNAYFYDAMAKASSTLNLGAIDTYNLGQKMSKEAIKKYRWKLAEYEAEALSLRQEDIDELKRFLDIIKQGNPWTFSRNIPCVFSQRKKAFVEPMINDFIRKYDIGFVIRLYFNTSLRSLISLEQFCESINDIIKLNGEIYEVFKRYPIYIRSYNQKMTGNNVYFVNEPDIKSSDLNDIPYYIVGFDSRRKRVKLSHI